MVMMLSKLTGPKTEAREPERQFVTFAIGEEEYGVDIMDVREIKGWTGCTKLPNAPHYIRGVINLRGVMVPVMDLRARFGQEPTEATKTHVVILVAISDRVVGMLVDAVSDILTVKIKDIRPAPDMERTVDSDYLAGLVAIDQRMVALLLLSRLFDTSRLPPLDMPAKALASAD